ncbi:hypothetical protein GCM10009837_03500 [Streptomyces durmitorensis]|uniref:hypothetical protein n=1 Tax=Streptomyces durmitorensis TaxID=319947 RepID=UPI00337CC282
MACGTAETAGPKITHAPDIPDHIPVIACAARDRTSSRDVLIALIRHLKERSAPALEAAR